MTFLKPEQRQTLWWIAFGLALCYLLYTLAAVLTPFLFAAIIGYVLNPGVDWLARHRVPRALATFLMIILFLLASIVLVLTIVPVMQRELGDLQKRIPDLLERLNTVVAPRLHDWFGLHIEFSAYSLRKLISDQWPTEDLMSTVMSSLKVGGQALFSLAATAFLLPIVLFYFLVDWHVLIERGEALVPRRWHLQALGVGREIDELLSQFLRGQLSVMLILAAYYSITLAVAGFDVALPVGVFTGLLVFIPYVGFATGLTLALLAALLQFGSLYGLGAVLLIYGLGQVLESFFLTPKLVGKRLGMSPLAVIFALLAFGELFGFFGVLLALPASAIVMVGLRHLVRAYLASDLYRIS
ncbi:MAG: AI-2E family transporter [Burkholderiaceae bacterium]|jgi:predicted PurR-regulated permease PerM